MVHAGIADLKASLSEYLERVKAGEEVIVTDRGRPVARLTPISALSDEVEQLVRRGIVRPPQRRLDVAVVTGARLPKDRDGKALAALLEERRGGR